MLINLIKIFVPTTLSFFIGIALTPVFMPWFFKYRLWKRNARKDESVNPDKMSPAFQAIHNASEELSTPRVGGVIIWVSIMCTALIIALIGIIVPSDLTHKLNFISRNQTLLLLIALLGGALIGLIDDLLGIWTTSGIFVNGFPRRYMVGIIVFIGLVWGSWFYFKLDVHTVLIPLIGQVDIGIGIIALFVLVLFGVFSSGVIDGIDGLAAGVMASVFASYATISFFQNQIDLAVFSAVVTGAILAFLWFNIPPARFYMGETGMLGLTVVLTVLAFMTDTVLILPIIAFPLTITALSSAIQIISKKYFGYKVFKVAPLHHHFEAIGWSRYKITMRYWVISVIFAIIGIIMALLS